MTVPDDRPPGVAELGSELARVLDEHGLGGRESERLRACRTEKDLRRALRDIGWPDAEIDRVLARLAGAR